MACKKVGFPTEEKARAALQRIMKNPENPLHMPTSYYECPSCGKWHLTKKLTKFTDKNPRRRNR